MALDLSALEDKPIAPQGDGNQGAPLLLNLADIEEDPKQPRKTFTDEAMAEITASIEERGVKSPVSVKPNPDKPGKWLLNYGARRYRGSIAAGKTTIPAFIDMEHNDYDQVAENLHRDDLKPMELALFIKKKLGDGEKKNAIAKALKKDNAYITQHLALLDAPACIEEAYSSGKCTSPKTLYELRSLFDKFPAEVEAWSAEADDISRRSVSELADRLKGKPSPTPVQVVTPAVSEASGKTSAEAEKFGHDQISTPAEPPQTPADVVQQSPTVVVEHPENPPVPNGPGTVGEGEPPAHRPKVTDPNRIAKPLLLVEHGGKVAALLLNRRPSKAGMFHIRYEESGVEAEVPANKCKLSMLTDSEK